MVNYNTIEVVIAAVLSGAPNRKAGSRRQI
jgi:hypothetical protein